MKIRLWGTEAECQAAAEALLHTPGLTVVSISEPRADRGASVLVRVYVEARLDAPGTAAPSGPRPARPDQRAGALAQRMSRRRALPPGGAR